MYNIFKEENNIDIYQLCTVCSSAKKRCCDSINIFGELVVLFKLFVNLYLFNEKKSYCYTKGTIGK